MKEQMQSLKVIEAKLNGEPDRQVSLTDSEVRSIKTQGTEIACYKVQAAVDTKHHLIGAHVVTDDDGIDPDQLTSMAKLTREKMGVGKPTAVATRGCCKSDKILACHEAGIRMFVPKTVPSSATANGRLAKESFIYNTTTNEYQCQAGARLIWRFSSVERGVTISNM